MAMPFSCLPPFCSSSPNNSMNYWFLQTNLGCKVIKNISAIYFIIILLLVCSIHVRTEWNTRNCSMHTIQPSKADYSAFPKKLKYVL